MFFQQIFEEKLAQYAYLIGCQATGEAIVIDPMRDINRYIEIAKRITLVLLRLQKRTFMPTIFRDSGSLQKTESRSWYRMKVMPTEIRMGDRE